MTMNNEPSSNLSGRTALVTGASRGIGRAIALRLAAAGADIALAARDSEALDEVATAIRTLGSTASTHIIDLGAESAANPLIDTVVQEHGQLNIVVNNAGGSTQGSLTELDDESWANAFNLKLFGGMRVARAAWPHLARNKGSLINIAGAAGWLGAPRGIMAATQCGAYYAMTKSMAALGLADSVQVNAINPGPVWTDRLKSQLPDLGIEADQPEESILEQVAARYALRKIARPEDVANLVAFVLSPSGGVFHGALINFDGGAAKGL
jgi:NAD(P)-dependent dehydrogenase (short-subunit alcohol dehydrogenase family)